MSTTVKAGAGLIFLLVLVILGRMGCNRYNENNYPRNHKEYTDLRETLSLKQGESKKIKLTTNPTKVRWKKVGYNLKPLTPNAKCILEYKGKDYPFNADGWQKGQPPFPLTISDEIIYCTIRSERGEVVVLVTAELVYQN